MAGSPAPAVLKAMNPGSRTVGRNGCPEDIPGQEGNGRPKLGSTTSGLCQAIVVGLVGIHARSFSTQSFVKPWLLMLVEACILPSPSVLP